MPATAVMFSAEEADALKQYAEQKGITPEAAIKELYDKEMDRRLRVNRSRGEVKTFPSLKKV